MDDALERWQRLQDKLRGLPPGPKSDEIIRQHFAGEDEQEALFVVQEGNEWLWQSREQPAPQMLFSELWHEGELCILFADTNVGKSILAVQIGEHIARGEAIPGFKLSCGPQRVLYFDFELAQKQFESRYSDNYTNHYSFSPNFYRAEINTGAIMEELDDYEKRLNWELEEAVDLNKAKVLIIDNLTYLKGETEKTKSALALMKQLKMMKQRFNISILALAHTPKRNVSKPITKNDLQGSKMLINFCDSAFAIGESQADKSLRYLKQIKQRSTESMYDANNVIVCQATKPGNFLQLEFLHYATEAEHLKTTSDAERHELEQKVKELLAADPAISAYALAQKLCRDQSKFESFKVKMYRLVQRLRAKEPDLVTP